ncbi:MAG: hypothetical protein ACXWYD_19335 [Candidatus Binatia bacterium]
MNDLGFSGLRRDNYKDHIAKLNEACKWLGITRGRSRDYIKLLTEFHESDLRTRQHVLAYNETCEIIDIYSLWQSRIDLFPGLKSEVSKALAGGPVLREEERTRGKRNNRNRARNDAFVYYLAGRLIDAGIQVLGIDGILRSGASREENADITIDSVIGPVDIQCKRPQSWRAFDSRVKEARRQIRSKNRPGIVAMDCSVVIRPPGHLLRTDSAAEAHKRIPLLLQSLTWSTLLEQRNKFVLGFLLFARVPLITTIGKSSILDFQGCPISYFQRESVSTHVLFNNRHSVNSSLLLPILERLKAQSFSVET